MEIYTAIGGYNEEYFIDCVDFDFSLRVRRAGYKILKDPAALLFHELGEKNNLPKLYKRYYALHSPLRRYYMSRNFLYLAQKYVVSDFGFIFKLLLSHVISFVLLIFYDPKPVTSVTMIFRGVSDFFVGKAGAFECDTL
jgi:rhamnosyltransferase